MMGALGHSEVHVCGPLVMNSVRARVRVLRTSGNLQKLLGLGLPWIHPIQEHSVSNSYYLPSAQCFPAL